MKTFVVVSDSHTNRGAFDAIDVVLRECDGIIHLGDISADGMYLRKNYGDKVTVINGNCDPIPFGEYESVIEAEGVKILCCHGHRYAVKQTPDKLCYRARELGCTVALYGHTHQKSIDEMGGVTLINPGNFTRYSAHSYCYLTVHQGKAVATLVDVHGNY